MGKILKIVMAIMLVFMLVACGDIELSLDAPKNVAINNGIVTWESVEGAEEYIVFVGTQQFTVTTTTFNLGSLGLGAGDHTVYVIAKAGDKLSLPSSNKTYTIQSIDLTLLNQALLLLIDPAYTLGMQESSFEDEWEYRDYQRNVSLVQTFSQTAFELGMDQAKALSMFTQVKNMGDGMEDVEDFTDIKLKLDAFDFDMDADEVAIMIYNLLLTSIDQIIIDENLSIARDEARLAEINLEIQGFKTSLAGAVLYTQLKALTSPSFYADLDAFFALDYEEWEFYNLMSTIGYSIAPNVLYTMNDAWYLTDPEPYVALFHNIFTNAKAAGQSSILEGFLYTEYPMLLNPFQSVNMYVYEKDWLTDSVEESEELIPMLLEFKALWIAEDDLFKQAIADFVSYATLLYDSVTPALVAALDTLPGGMFGLDEIFIIKDEVLNILITTLPDPEAFGDMYEVLFTISAVFGDINATQYMAHAPYLGEIDHAVIELILLYLDTVSQTDLENILEITESLTYQEEVTYSYTDWETDEIITETYYEQRTDPYAVLELALYLLNHVDVFVTANQTKIDALDALLDDAEMQQIYVKFIQGFKAIALEQMEDEDDAEILTLVADELIAAYLPIRDVLDLFGDIGSGFIEEFLATDAALFFGILDLQDYLEPSQAMLIDIELLIDLFVPYNAAFFTPMDLPTIENVLRLIKIPAKVAAVQDGVLATEFDTAFNAIVDEAAQVIFNVKTLQGLVVAHATALDLDGVMYLNNWEQDFDTDLMLTVVILLDNILTAQFETLLYQTINLVFDGVLENSNVLLITEMLQSELNIEQADFIDMVEKLIADIRLARTYTVGVPTPEQIEFIRDLFDMGGSQIVEPYMN
jgi:hypothetical protein